MPQLRVLRVLRFLRFYSFTGFTGFTGLKRPEQTMPGYRKALSTVTHRLRKSNNTVSVKHKTPLLHLLLKRCRGVRAVLRGFAPVAEE